MSFSLSSTLLSALLLVSQARSAPAPAATSKAESFEQREARLDATVWSNEILGLKFERTFVKLRDALRHATNKIAVLAEFDFDEILLPKPKPASTLLDLGIRLQSFDDQQKATLQRAEWEQTLRQLAARDWRVIQAEWTHENFIPPAGASGAKSEFHFEIDGERLSATTRFMVRGTLEVQWDARLPENAPPRPRRITVTKVSVWEREGKPGFSTHAAIIPEVPDSPTSTIDLHPLIVTDLDGDGNEDILLPEVNKLFLNDGKAAFRPIDLVAENHFRGANKAGVIADFNNDGKLDFLTVGTEGAFTNRLILYPGGGAPPFEEEPRIVFPGQKIPGASVLTAGDIDHDGDLDVWLAQYKPPYIGGQVPTPYYDAKDGYPSYLLLNDGHGQFKDATAERGLSEKRRRRTFSASFADLTGDGHLDLLTVNDFSGVDLYYNDGQGRFVDESARLGERHLFGMAHRFADFDGDGALDIFCIGMSVTSVRRLEAMKLGRDDEPERTRQRGAMTYGNRLFLSRGSEWVQPQFANDLARTGWSWGTTVFDFDNDGDLDVYVANGFISGESAEDYCSHCWRHDIYLGSSRDDRELLTYFARALQNVNTGKTSWNGHQHEVLFLDLGQHHYLDAAFLMGVAHETDCRGVVSADLNNDGKRDLVLTERQWFVGPAMGRHRVLVHLNQLPTTNHWIGVKLSSRKPGVSIIGATVHLETPGKKYVSQLVTGDSFQSQHPNSVHFGLGPVGEVNELTVRWPDGRLSKIERPAVDRYHRLEP